MNLALVDPQNSVNRIQSDTLIDPAVQTKIGWRWLPVETVGGGSYDPETQVLEGPVYSVQVAKVVETFTIRTKTQTELDADKDANGWLTPAEYATTAPPPPKKPKCGC